MLNPSKHILWTTNYYSTCLLLFSHKVMSDSFASPWTLAQQARLSMGFSRQEYWSGCYFLLQKNFLTQLWNPSLPLSGRQFLSHWALCETLLSVYWWEDEREITGLRSNNLRPKKLHNEPSKLASVCYLFYEVYGTYLLLVYFWYIFSKNMWRCMTLRAHHMPISV